MENKTLVILLLAAVFIGVRSNKEVKVDKKPLPEKEKDTKSDTKSAVVSASAVRAFPSYFFSQQQNLAPPNCVCQQGQTGQNQQPGTNNGQPIGQNPPFNNFPNNNNNNQPINPNNNFPNNNFPNNNFPNNNFPNNQFPNNGQNFPNNNQPINPNNNFPNNGQNTGNNFPNNNFPNNFPSGSVTINNFPNANFPNANFPNSNLPNSNNFNPNNNFPNTFPNNNFPNNNNNPNNNFPNNNFPNNNFNNGQQQIQPGSQIDRQPNQGRPGRRQFSPSSFPASMQICGTDGITYTDVCQIINAQSRSPSLGGRPCNLAAAISSLQVPQGQGQGNVDRSPGGPVCMNDGTTMVSATAALSPMLTSQGIGIRCEGRCPCTLTCPPSFSSGMSQHHGDCFNHWSFHHGRGNHGRGR